MVQHIPVFKSREENQVWAGSGLVASVLEGDSALVLQQRVEDAGFHQGIVTPMGGDRVFLHCDGGDDIWQIFNNALHFFGMLFSNIHKWTTTDPRYERGAWLRVYGVPVHAWNEEFFRLCMLGIGRLFVWMILRLTKHGWTLHAF